MQFIFADIKFSPVSRNLQLLSSNTRNQNRILNDTIILTNLGF